MNRNNPTPRLLLIACFLTLNVFALNAPAFAISACLGGTCAACAPAVGGAVGNLLPNGTFTDPDADTPIAFVDPRDNSRRRFIATQQGAILVWDGGTGALSTFLDLRDTGGGPHLVLDNASERGLLAMAFAPDYAVSGHFFVYYTSVSRAGESISAGDIVVERYTRSAGNPAVADPNSRLLILAVEHPHTNHNGGWLAFGPNDGYLYITLGDGGTSCDGAGPFNGQNVNVLLGKMLRIDVTSTPTTPDCGNDDTPVTNYAIPASNPLVGDVGCDEIWDYGLRNPFRFSFDRANGDIFIGDVGQDNWEEFNFQSASLPAHEAPMNFGWVVREGCDVSGVAPSGCGCTIGVDCPAANQSCQYPAPGGYWDPILCHSNPSPNGWSSALGGYRYRGAFVPPLANRYLYSDVGRGDIWITSTFDPEDLPATAACCWDQGNGGIYSFAEDHLGELYIVNGGGRVDCIHNGAPGGCYWARWGGFFEDGFETGNTGRWSLAQQ